MDCPSWHEGGIVKWFVSREADFLAEPMDIAGLRQAVFTLLNNKHPRIAMGKQAREHEPVTFNVKIAVARFITA